MLYVNLFDANFSHTEELLGYITASDFRKPTKIEWLSKLPEHAGTTVFTDLYISDIIRQVKSDFKFIWLIEPQSIHPHSYQAAIKYQDDVDCVFTHDYEFARKYLKNYKLVPVASSRIYQESNRAKADMVSMIASNKNMTYGHNFRHEIAKNLSEKYNIHMWGSGYKPFHIKNEPLESYYFSVCVMNSRIDNFFTEVIIDPLITKTIPIYWGSDKIYEHFHRDGIIIFDSSEELESILSQLSVELYHSKIDAVMDNYNRAQSYVSTDDIIYNFIMDYFHA